MVKVLKYKGNAVVHHEEYVKLVEDNKELKMNYEICKDNYNSLLSSYNSLQELLNTQKELLEKYDGVSEQYEECLQVIEEQAEMIKSFNDTIDHTEKMFEEYKAKIKELETPFYIRWVNKVFHD